MARRASADLTRVIRDFRREQIIEVARRLFGERGTTDVSMDEIASEADVARSTVYVYFANRDELVRACLKQLYTAVQAALAEAWGRHVEPDLRLGAVVHGLLARIDEDPAFFRLAVTAHARSDATGAAIDAELAHIGLDMAGLLEDLVRDGVERGVFRPLAPQRGALLIGQQLYGAMAVRAGDPAPGPLHEAAEEITEFVLLGLRA